MYRFQHVPEYGEPFQLLVCALHLLRTHTAEKQKEPVLELIASPTEAAETAARASQQGDHPIAIFDAPGATATPSVFMHEELQTLRAAVPDLRIVLVVGSEVVRQIRSPGPRTVHHLMVQDGERGPAVLAERLKRFVAGPWERDLLKALPEALPCEVRLLLARGLEDLRSGVVRSAPELARASRRHPERVEESLVRIQADGFSIWWERTRAYACLRLARERGMPLQEAAKAAGFCMEELDEVCQRHTGTAPQVFVEAGTTGANVLAGMSVGAAARTPAPPPAVDDGEGAYAFLTLRKQYVEAALRVARSILSSPSEAQELVDAVFAAISLMDPTRRATIGEGYVVKATRNRAKDRLRAKRRQPKMVDINRMPTPSNSISPDLALERRETERKLRRALVEVGPLLGGAWCLCDWLGWPSRDAAPLLGCSRKALERRRARARAKLSDRIDPDDLRP